MDLGSRSLAVLLLLACATGCSRGRGAPTEKVCSDTGAPCESNEDCDAGATCVDASTVTFTTVLKPLGFIAQKAYPGHELELKVVLLRSSGSNIDSADDIKPMPSEVVSWSLVSGSSTAQLADTASLTNDDGIAVITVNTGTTQGVSFQVRASVPGVDPITFSVQVQVDTRELRLLTPAVLDSVVDRTERVRVQWIRPVPGTSGIPVAGQPLKVQLVGGPRNGAQLVGAVGAEKSIVTDVAGIATVQFATGTSAQEYDLLFCGAQSCANTPAKSITVKVALRGNGGGCQYFTDCEPGFICAQGVCELAATYCDTSDDCDVGYVCGAGRVCEVAQPGEDCTLSEDCDGNLVCGTADTCIPPEGCLGDTDCPEDFLCDEPSGACVPDPQANLPIVDVSGDWLTRYKLDISDALPSFFHDGLGPVVRFLNLAFRSELEINIPIVGDILEAFLDSLIAQYVPSWVITVVSILDDFISVFEHMEVEALMTLYQPGNPVGLQVSGEEDWSNARFFVPSLCPGGLVEFQNNPNCGAVDVVLHPKVNLGYSNNTPEVGVKVDPFNGLVIPPPRDESVDHFTLRLLDREIEMELSQLINVMLDLIVVIASNGQWYYFEDFLVDLVPCYELQIAIDDMVYTLTNGNISSIPGIEQACEAAATLAVNALTNELGKVELRVLKLDFNTDIVVHDDGNATNPTAIQLGNPPNPPPECSVDGDLRAAGIFKGDLDGSWWFGVVP